MPKYKHAQEGKLISQKKNQPEKAKMLGQQDKQ